MKKKYARGNNGHLMNGALRKAIMLRSQLKNKYNKNCTVENWEAFCKQWSLCVKLFRTAKRNFYNNSNISQITDNSLSFRMKISLKPKLL